MAERRDGSGVLYPEREKKNPKGPDFKGEILLEGRVYKLSAWKRESQYGTFLSLNWSQWKPPETKQFPAEVKPAPDGGDLPW